MSDDNPRALRYHDLLKSSDEQLMRELQAGNADAFAVVFDRYHRLVLVTALRTLHDAGEAEDLTQTIFLEIYRTAARFDPSRGTLKMWVLQFAYNKSISRRNYLSVRQYYNQTRLEEMAVTMQELRNKNKTWFPSYTGAPKSLEASRWYWANEFSYDPAPDLKKVKIPVLAIFGELDTLVNVKESATIMEEILKKEGNKDYTIKVLPKVGHGMIVWAEKGSRWHWSRLVDGYLETITEWVLKRVHIPMAEA